MTEVFDQARADKDTMFLAELEVHPLDVATVQAIFAAFPDRYRVAVVVAAGCGLRQGEALGLERRHIDFLRRTLRVDQQVQQDPGGVPRVCPPKTRTSYRTIPLPKTVVDELAAHLASYPTEGRCSRVPTADPSCVPASTIRCGGRR